MSREEMMQLVSHATKDKLFYKKLVSQPKKTLQNADFLNQETKDSIVKLKPEQIQDNPSINRIPTYYLCCDWPSCQITKIVNPE
ncbi:hypothetical protein RE438_31380 (plasmid) [Bacillus wiedmannii]|uniref:hypothetical protein n=1 Tax=Bacillus wiedmannii TaxID=1890302 RepID=UPI00065B8C85|nr:hypothetical protein [Bacillus wiedmannii]KMP77364.1 hypothetical protein TU62_04660 [Bacillus cereus]WMS85370.1 hypothetical protein RE438_31380 [Bacillus wiedmannii]